METEISKTPRVCFLILASNDPINERDRESQESTWCSNLPENVTALWVRGTNSSDYRQEDSVLYVPCIEKYENILEKSVGAISWAYQNVDFDFLVRTNVSTYFDIQRVQRILAQRVGESHYFAGFIDSFKDVFLDNCFLSNIFVTGTGMYFSRDTCQVVAELDYTQFIGVPDDVAISQYLISKQIDPQFIRRGNLYSTHIFIPSAQIRLKSSVVSDLATNRFGLVHSFFLSTTLFERAKTYLAIERFELANIQFGGLHLKSYILRNLHIIRLNLRLVSNRLERKSS